MTRECRNCMWWIPDDVNAGLTGVCHGAPPSFSPLTGGARWPVTLHVDWCGAFRIREDKTQGTES